MKEIDVMIVGAPKAGTTSLKNYLGQHPGVRTHAEREMRFFASDVNYALGFEHVFPLYFHDDVRPAHIIVAKSVAMMYSPDALTRLRRHNPQVHIVLVFRNPVDRAYSEYWYARRRGWETAASFEAALELEICSRSSRGPADPKRAYLRRGTYYECLVEILEMFDRSQVHVFLLEDLQDDATAVCQQLYGLFPALDTTFCPRVTRRENSAAFPRYEALPRLLVSPRRFRALRGLFRVALGQTAAGRMKGFIQRSMEKPFTPPPMAAGTRRLLLDYYEPHNSRLSALIARDLSHWN